MTWTHNGHVFELNHDDGWFGFVYLITNTINDRKYIGKKQFYFSRKKRGKRILIESDWKEYYGSSEKLLLDVANYGKEYFTRDIISLHKNKRDLSYTELQEQFNRNVLEDETYYNDSIGGKWFRYIDGIFEKKNINVFEINGTQYFCHSEKRRNQLSEKWKKSNPNNAPGAKERMRERILQQANTGNNSLCLTEHTDETKRKISESNKGKKHPRILCFDGEEVLTITSYMKKYRMGYYSVVESINDGLIMRATEEQISSYSCGKVLSEEHKEKLRNILSRIRKNI